MATTSGGAAAEWRKHFMLPVSAALGYSVGIIHVYGISAYIAPIGETFGWSRTEVAVGITISTVVQALTGIPFGLLIDRYGPRRFALLGIPLIAFAFALLGTATGSALNWYVLWAFIALATLPAQAIVFTSAVATRFHASRGLAFAVTLCGASVAATVYPWLATLLIERFGWQHAIMFHAAIATAVVMPVVLPFFRGAGDMRAAQEPAAVLTGVSLREGLRSSIFARLFAASLCFTFTMLALVVHFVPILTGAGATPLKAAGVASLIGVSSIAGRLGTGFLIDRFTGSKVGAIAFLLPATACLLLLTLGHSAPAQAAAAVMVGLTLGAEVDVIFYLVARHFGLKSFGGLSGGMITAMSIGTASGPICAAMIFDATGSYAVFLMLAAALMLASSLSLASLPRPFTER